MILTTALKLLRKKMVQNLFFIISQFITTSMVLIIVNMLNNSFYDFIIASNGSQIIFDESMISSSMPQGDYFPLIFATLLYSVFLNYYISNVFFRKNLLPALNLMLIGFTTYSAANIILSMYAILVLPTMAAGFLVTVKVFIPMIDSYLYGQFDIVNAPVGRIYHSTFPCFFAIIGLIVVILMMMYHSKIMRNTVSELMHDQTRPSNRYFSFLSRKISTAYNAVIYLSGIVMFAILRNTAGSFICLLLGIYGSFGLLSKTMPNLVGSIKSSRPSEETYVVLSNYAKDIKDSFFSVGMLLVSVISTVSILARSTHHRINYIISSFSLLAIITMICLSIISQFFMNLPERQKENWSLYIEGINRKQIRKLIGEEIILYFLTIIMVPGIYVFLTLIDASLSNTLSASQALALGMIFLVPLLISAVLVFIYYTLNILQKKGK